jgi:pimeloyl-ACP methyl ester carboxylesterase
MTVIISFDEESINMDWNGTNVHVLVQKPIDRKPTLLVIHGVKRNHEKYFDRAMVLHESIGWGIVAPQFNEKAFPGIASFQHGGVLSMSGEVADTRIWSFKFIGRLLDRLAINRCFRNSSFGIFGHSAGAQFVHRMAIADPDERIKCYFAANAGTYTMIDSGVS